MTQSASAVIEIAAPPNKVWAVLTDYDRYPEWNPFIVNLSGEKEVGGKLNVTIKPPSDGSGTTTFKPIIQTFSPNEHLSWDGRLLGVSWIFSGQHHFILRPTETGTRFENSEQFKGVMASALHLAGSKMFETTQKGFGMMNTALKERVEGSR